MLNELKELWKFRELLFSMVERDLRIRYKNSFFGFLWSLLNPLLTVVVMTFVFQTFMQNPTKNLSAYILAAYLPYMFFQLCLMDSAQTILGNVHLIKKIYFPREILPLAAVMSNFVHFALALVVFFVYLIGVYIVHPGIFPFHSGILLVPVLLVINFCLVTGLAFLISAANAFYEDVKYMVGVVLYLLFFLCPIMYFVEQVYHSTVNKDHAILYKIYNLNPIAELCTAYRKAILDPQPVYFEGQFHAPIGMDWKYLWITAGFSVLILFVGYGFFNRMKWRFVERP